MDALAVEQFRTLERDHWWFRGRRAVYLGVLREHLGASRPRRALDLGCGTGGFVPGLAELSDQVVAADFDASFLRTCRARGLEDTVHVAGDRLPFGSARFDLACLFDVLEHLADDRGALCEVYRTLRPGGHVCISVPAYPALFSNNDRIAGHHRRYTRRSLAAVLESAGFEVERNTHANVLLFPLILPVVLATKAWEALRPRAEPRHTNLSWPVPPAVDELCYRAFTAELALSRRRDLPLGHSILAIARRPPKSSAAHAVARESA